MSEREFGVSRSVFFVPVPLRFKTASAAPTVLCQEMMSFTTVPWTSVRRKGRPLWVKVSFS